MFSDDSSMHLGTAILLLINIFNFKLNCASNRAGWAPDPNALSPILRDSDMLEHINLLNLKVLIFCFSISMKLIFRL